MQETTSFIAPFWHQASKTSFAHTKLNKIMKTYTTVTNKKNLLIAIAGYAIVMFLLYFATCGLAQPASAQDVSPDSSWSMFYQHNKAKLKGIAQFCDEKEPTNFKANNDCRTQQADERTRFWEIENHLFLQFPDIRIELVTGCVHKVVKSTPDWKLLAGCIYEEYNQLISANLTQAN